MLTFARILPFAEKSFHLHQVRSLRRSAAHFPLGQGGRIDAELPCQVLLGETQTFSKSYKPLSGVGGLRSRVVTKEPDNGWKVTKIRFEAACLPMGHARLVGSKLSGSVFQLKPEVHSALPKMVA